MFPAILPFRPDLAKEMLNYRVRNMDQAMLKAQESGYRGARSVLFKKVKYDSKEISIENVWETALSTLKLPYPSFYRNSIGT